MSTFICWQCHSSIAVPSAMERYCPYCGFAYVLPCSYESCLDKATPRDEISLIFTGKSASCSTCGTLYRYDKITNQAIKTLANGPFEVPLGSSNLLVDFDPNVMDRSQEQAFRLQRDASPFSSPSAANRDIAPLAAVQVRHRRVYVLISQTGEIKAYNSDTLTPAGDFWRQTYTPGWQPNPQATAVSFVVTASLILVRLNAMLYGFDAARGGQKLFSLPLAESDPRFAAFNDSLLCLQSNGKGGREFALYSVTDLVTARDSPVKSAKRWPDPDTSAPAVKLPPQRILMYDKRAFLVDRSGSVILLDYAQEKPKRIFENINARPVFALAGGTKQVVVLLAPGPTDESYSLVSFDPQQTTFEADSLTGNSLQGLRPHPNLKTLLIEGMNLYLLTEYKSLSTNPETSGCFWRIPLEGISYKSVCSVPTLTKDETLMDLNLLPLLDSDSREVKPLVCLYTKDTNRYFFHVVRLNSDSMADYKSIRSVASLAKNTVEVYSTQKGVVVANLTDGRLHYTSYSKILEASSLAQGARS